MVTDQDKIELPAVTASYLLPFFFEVGPVVSTGFGPAPISFSEIESYQRQNGIEFNPWEVSTLRLMSRAYAHESSSATLEGATAPWMPKKRMATKPEIQDGVREALRALSHTKRKANG